jgi:uncharacterized GH25 family protein
MNVQTITDLKGLYNTIAIQKGQWQTFVNNAGDPLTKNIAQAKVDAYTDCMNIINAQIAQNIAS